MHESKNLSASHLIKFAVYLDGMLYVVKTYWSDELHTH